MIGKAEDLRKSSEGEKKSPKAHLSNQYGFVFINAYGRICSCSGGCLTVFKRTLDENGLLCEDPNQHDQYSDKMVQLHLKPSTKL
jgi:hypothetical protein